MPSTAVGRCDLPPQIWTLLNESLSGYNTGQGRIPQMKSKRFTEEQIITILKEAQAGVAVKDLTRQHGIAEGTYYRWKAKFGGMDVSDAKRLRALEEENRRLKTMVADLMLDNKVLRDINSKNW